ncbi:MAG: 3-methyl-2-oxobutanoate hydroxymethyltransferase, partial [Dehalococcoidales bacterium]|nr:3-methyl-2-oxobutanoate hydroxymethyltransferase [Dehalococcoidales bacterium]
MRVTINQIKEMKQKGEKIVMITSYDYATAKLVESIGIPMILVGDSLGMVVLGYETPIPVTMDVMIHHTKAVVRGTSTALIVGDMPFMTYHVSTEEALRNAARFIQEAGAQAVKLEGGITVADKVRRIVECGIPVMGHLRLTPQSVHQLGGLKAQARTLDTARRLIEDAVALEQAGAFAVVLEAIPYRLAEIITKKLKIPTIGIGAGPACDGQVQVINDVLGLFTEFVPRHAKQYARLADIMTAALKEYYEEVRTGKFPTEKNSYTCLLYTS